MEFVYEYGIGLQGRFTTCKHHMAGWASEGRLHDGIQGHAAALAMLCVTERTFQVTSRKTYEERWCPYMETFALERIEYFIDTIGCSHSGSFS